MGKAYWKDVWRAILKSKKRFFSIMLITMLGVTVLTGIYAACQDMYRSADRFYDDQRLFDIRILSTLGLTDDDVEALRQVPGVEALTGAYSETVRTVVNGVTKDAEVVVLTESGLNLPYLLEGHLPSQPGEMVVTQAYLDDAGKTVGDTVDFREDLDTGDETDTDDTEADSPTLPAPELESAETEAEDEADNGFDTDIDWDADIEIEEEAETPTFPRTHFTITGLVLDPADISNNALTFRTTATTDYTFFIGPQDADYEVYSSIYITLEGLNALNCYTDEYEAHVRAAVEMIEGEIMRQREQARTEAVLADALALITDAEATMQEKFSEADQQFADAWAEIADAKKELLDGEAELTREEQDALQKLADARTELEDGKAQLHQAEADLAAGEAELEANAKKLADGKKQLAKEEKAAQKGFEEAEKLFTEKQAGIDATLAELLPGIEQMRQPFGEAFPQAEWDALVAAAAAKTAELLAENPEAEPDPLVVAAATTDAQNALAAALMSLMAAQTPQPGPEAADATEPVSSNAATDTVKPLAFTEAGQADTPPATEGCGQNTAPDSSTTEEPEPQEPPADPATAVGPYIQAALGLGIINGGQQVLSSQLEAYETQKKDALKQLEKAKAELDDGEKLIDDGREELAKGREQIAASWTELADGEAELNREEAKALQEIADAWRELAEGKQELAEGEAELVENAEKYEEKQAEARQKLADAYSELEDIDMAEWYVQDRTALNSYASLKSDMSSIEAVGNAFPIVFLVVAILISLTTMARMVEEERGLIGTYKALGFGNGAIYFKYLFYAFLACLLGGLLGDVFGFVLLPTFLITILQVMYTLPYIHLSFDGLYGIGGVLLFMVCIVGATAYACRKELAQMPAMLMRPKAPRAGSRIILERIPLIWNRLRFLNKVTARNLFRYKKRLFMTVLGITGCTALVLAGFAIRDSVTDLMPKQYEQVYRYDLMTVTDAEDNDAWLQQVADDDAITDYMNLQIANFKLVGDDGTSESVQLLVVPTGGVLEDYIGTRNRDGQPVQLDASGIFITQNAAEMLALEPGDSVTLQSLQLDRATVMVSEVVQNYLGNNVYIAQELYEPLFGTYAPNGMLAYLAPTVTNQPAWAEALLENDIILSAVSTEALKADFATNFALINSVVYILIVLAAALAFVVLFTLSNTNISERTRELATIKVLGFFDREVHAYVNKETLILTAIGIVAGLPAGRFVIGLLTAALKMPSLYFAVYVEPLSYLLAAVLSFCFALIVNLMTNRTLNRIDMVEALKSVE